MRKAFSFSIFRVLAASQLIAAHKTSKPALDEAMRKLWTDHVVYTRLYIIAAVNGTDDAQPTAARLLKNQEHIGNAIIPYYGTAAGHKLTDLLSNSFRSS
jgi:hypothetical protein